MEKSDLILWARAQKNARVKRPLIRTNAVINFLVVNFMFLSHSSCRVLKWINSFKMDQLVHFNYIARTFCLYRQTNLNGINGQHGQDKTTEIANTRFYSQKSFQELIISELTSIIFRNSIGNFTFRED